MTAPPVAPDPIPEVPDPVPQRSDWDNFPERGDEMMTWFVPGMAAVNTMRTYFIAAMNWVVTKLNEITALANSATASEQASAANAAAAAASANAVLWVTGTNYPVPSSVVAGARVYSPSNQMVYVDTVGGLSSTDPASDVSGRWVSGMLPSVEAIGLPDMYPTAVLIGNGQIDRRLVQGRTATKYRYNSFGNLEALPAGVSKVDFHPVTKRCEGYKPEPALNYIPINSADFAGWGGSDTGGGFGAAVAAPDGTLTAKTWTVPTSTSQFAYGQKILYGGFDASSQVVFEIWARRQSGAGSFGLGASDISAVSNSDVVTVDSTWRKVSFTSSTLTNTGNIGVGFNGTAGDVFELWHPTLTLGTTKNPSYYPTVGSLVTTVEDNLTLDLTAHTDIVNPNEFTLVFDLDATNFPNTGLIFYFAGPGSEQIYVQRNLANWTLVAANSGGIWYNGTVAAFSADRAVFALSMSPSGSRLVFKGAAVVELGAAAMTVMEAVYVGRYVAGGYSANSPIKTMLAYPRACTAGELIALVNNI